MEHVRQAAMEKPLTEALRLTRWRPPSLYSDNVVMAVVVTAEVKEQSRRGFCNRLRISSTSGGDSRWLYETLVRHVTPSSTYHMCVGSRSAENSGIS